MSSTIKKLLRSSFLLLPVSLLAVFFAVEARVGTSSALQSALAQAPKIAPNTAAAVDEYTQSEAHLQIGEVKAKMEKFIMRVPEDDKAPKYPRTPNEMVTPYLNIVNAALNKEVELKNTHYAFYNASNNEWRVPQDLYKKLYVHYKKPGSQLDDFAFVRFSNGKSIKAQDFLKENIAEWGGVNDNEPAIRDIVMSVNLYLFGNVGFPGECSWNYFLETKSHRIPAPQNYQEILNAFDVTYDIEALAKEAGALSEMLINSADNSSQKGVQTLFQFFVPQDKVDDVAYIAWVLGFPAHAKSIEQMEAVLAIPDPKTGKIPPRVGVFTGKAVKDVMKQFKGKRATPETDAVYKELVEATADGKFGVSGFMESLRNNPFGMPNVNETQGRLLVTDPIFQNPASGVKVFTYFTTPEGIQRDYMNKLNALAQKVIAAESSKTKEQKDADRKKNEATVVRIKAEEKAKAEAEKAKATPAPQKGKAQPAIPKQQNKPAGKK
jgi:hypothetical protein